MNWIMVYVVEENIVVCILYLCGKRKTCRHGGVPKHNAQSGEIWPLLHHGYSPLNRWCTKYSKKKRHIPPVLSHDCLAPRVSLDFPQAKYCLFRSAVACNCETIHLLLYWGVWMWVSPLTCVHKVFIFYKDWMFILSEVWACDCRKTKKKSQKTYNCTAMRVYSCIRGVDCVIKTCAVNQWLSVQPRPVNSWNNTKGKKIYSTSIVVWDFMFWMLHVLLMVCQYILSTDYV